MTPDIHAARRFAEMAHKGQWRKSTDPIPYATHVIEVADLVAEWGGDDIAICAALLHDTVEDCDVTTDQISTRFGQDVAAIVAEVTDNTNLPTPERKALQIANAPGKSARAALLKLADKTANVTDIYRAPAPSWSVARKLAYIAHARAVVSALPQGALPAKGLIAFDAAATRATQAAQEKGRPEERPS